ncbi:class I SAM-dependent methyltransferase [Sphingobium sufflavum]|uniref:class I SAM-dependent methyltransferase n=1 Tax=Sphingobium sufflavum TaxID=1129547 RepID=UPI001F1631C6|nr:class I SAM-dependent methyltransferase [Sphingobium sufflavum]MCE7798364.1 class I SAM-dependent methyltransferase [Sphingobium sufflavum]
MTRTNSPPNPGHDAVVQHQFGPQAQAYVSSSVHAAGIDLDGVEARVAAVRPAHALDLGAGGGHVAYRMAAHAGRVTACDLSPDMVAAIESTARDRGIATITGAVAAAEDLPFATGQFDCVASRFSAHHWRDWEAGLRQARRVLAPGGLALFADIVAPAGNAMADTHLQAVELLRDPSHVRDYRLDEWLAALARAGFAVREVATHRLRMDFPTWIARMATPDVRTAAIRSLQGVASADVADHFGLEPDGSFTVDAMMIVAG